MKDRFILAAFLLLFVAGLAIAGPVDTPLPANTCPGAATLQLALVANEVGTDIGGAPCGGGGACAETMVVCHHIGKSTDAPIDIALEQFTFAGVLIAAPLATACAVPPGGSAPFVTPAPLAPPYIGIPFGSTQVPLGSLRVLSTSKRRVACDVTLIDTSAIFLGFSPTPTATKDVTVTAATKGQKGD